MAKKPEYTVTVISRREIVTFPKIGTPVPVVIVSYVGAGLPPGSVRILKSEHTEVEEKRRIRADLERRLKEKAESFVV